MSKTDTRLILSLVGLLLAGPLAAQIGLEASTTELPVTEALSLAGFPPNNCPTSSADDWSIDPGVDGSVISEQYFVENDFIEWDITWTSGGTKSILVSIAGCPETGEIDIDVNTCAFNQETYQALEELGYVQFQVERVGGTAGELSCDLQVIGGTATDGEDFTFDGATFFWMSGDGEPQAQAIEVVDNSLVEATETIDLELRPFDPFAQGVHKLPSGVRVPSPGTVPESDFATVEILDNDPASVSFQVSSVSVAENDFAVDLVIERSGADGAFDVSVGVTGGSASPSDVFFGSVGLSFGETDSSKSVTVFVSEDDDAFEGDETVEISLSSPTNGVTLGSIPTATVIIQDSGVCEFTSTTFDAPEDAGSATVFARRAGGTAGILECLALTVAGEGPNAATPEQDYAPTSQVFTWSALQAGTRSLSVPIVDDDLNEGGLPEIVQLELRRFFGEAVTSGGGDRSSGPVRVASKGIVVLDTAQLVIVDNDGATPSSFSFVEPGSEAFETDGATTIGVRRTGDGAGEVSVEVVVAGGDAEPEDYSVASPLVLTWSDGETGVEELEVELAADADDEPDENVVLRLTNPQGPPSNPPVIVEPSEHILTILDVKAGGIVRFTSASFTGSEGETGVQVDVVREGGSSGAASVDVCLGDGTVELDDLLLPASTTLEWAEGELGARTLDFGIVDDVEIEGSESLPLELCELGGEVTLGQPNLATLTLLDNDFETSEEIVIAGPATGPEDPIVVYDRAGRKIVVWVASDGDGFGVFAQLFDVDGVPIGPVFQVNEDPAGDSTQPSAILRDDGTVVIVWRQTGGDALRAPEGRLASLAGGGSSVVSRGFDPSAGTSTSETVVSSSETEGSQNPEVGTDRDGEVTVTWEDGGNVRGQLLDQDLEPQTPVIDISELAGAEDPEVAVAASGDFVVVWRQPSGGSGEAQGTILVRRFNDRGAPRGEIEVVSDDPQAGSPAVAIDDQGNFFVVFTRPGDEGIDVYGRLFDRRGRRRGPLLRLNSNVTGNQTSPRVDMNSIGDIAVVWESDPGGVPGAVGTDDTSIVSRFFNPQGEAQSGDVEVAETEAGSAPQAPDVSIEDEDEVTVVFERRGPGNETEGIFSKVIDPKLISGPCFGDSTTLCVRAADRFRILVEWQDFEGNSGEGQAIPLTDDTGYFWFFGPDNVEILIKVLDGCAINDRLWVFAGGLTNVEVNLRVDDVFAGVTRSYFNTLGRSFEPIIDINAFDTCAAEPPNPAPALLAIGERVGAEKGERVGAELGERIGAELDEWTRALAARFPAQPPELRPEVASGVECGDGETTLCLRNGRFEATLLWESSDAAGAGHPVQLTDETGTFWFFQPENVEAVVKVLDGCALNGHYWVFAAGITDVATDLQVLDTQSSTSRQYTGELGTPFAPVLDTSAFECQ